MPGALRRLYSDSECSEGSWGGCETPQCVTPPKRRRLNILHSGSSASGGKSKPEVQVAAASQPPRGWSAEEFARSTPSRVDGVSERDERSQRMLISERARDVVRGLLGHGTSVSPAIELTRLRAQGLACYYVQLFYMSVSLTREDCDVVALAASLSALKSLNIICFADEVLRVFNEQQLASGEPELVASEEVARSPEEQILEVEARMAKLSPAGAGQCAHRPSLPLDSVDFFVEDLVLRLPSSQAFSSCCHSRQPADKAAQKLAPQLKELARCFAVDAMLGLAPIMQRPEVVARTVAALAVRYLLQQLGAEVTGSELMGFVAQGSPGQSGEVPSEEQLRSSMREVFGTYQLWQEEWCAESAGADAN
ncbi:unnamed protein product [Polarella glacialis]|uniref:Uncharacterized protein n=1 Tax=Polarella glacialis TaxID=89957 RepID=A0A813F9Q3_POLGL|nr:unnamed protein product [Polarella glacialis]